MQITLPNKVHVIRDLEFMPCISPITVGPPDSLSVVRCGRCKSCRLMRKASWIGRMVLERSYHSHARFVTLTYATDPGLLNPRDITLFMKQVRNYYGPFRYFSVGEYGDKHGRGHWHAVLYGIPQEFQGHWLNNPCWKHGFSYDGSVTLASIAYVAAYALKNTDKSKPTITRMSLKPGIGLQIIESLGATLAASYQTAQLERWPRCYRVENKTYPVVEGGMVALKRGFINAGGLPPVDQTPDERHILALDHLGDLGTRIEAERRFNTEWMLRRGKLLGPSVAETFAKDKF